MTSLPEKFDGPLHIAIIGGTGLSHLPSFTQIASLPLSHPALSTPWGAPSSPITILSHPRPSAPPLNVAFLSRHGLYHEHAPHEVPNRANIAALRKLGVRCVVAFSAVGSLREEFKPRDFSVPDQVIDRTKGVRPWTYFEGGLVGHTSFADPFDNALRSVIVSAVDGKEVLKGENIRLHHKGTLVCMGMKVLAEQLKADPSLLTSTAEGPQFSTRAESHLYRSWSASCINMSCLPEAKLAREAELGYAMICMSTDYDCWRSENEAVSVEMVMGHMTANAENAKHVVAAILDELGREEAGKEEHGDLIRGKQWEGQVKWAAGMTKVEGRNQEAVMKARWLFPEYF